MQIEKGKKRNFEGMYILTGRKIGGERKMKIKIKERIEKRHKVII